MDKKDSINPVNPKDILIGRTQSLPEALAAALSAQASDVVSPVLIVESPLAAQAVKAALARASWPGRILGAPLPKCLTLEAALEELIDWAAIYAPEKGLPRSLGIRCASLAQELLDHPSISASLGGSAKAALDLAQKWVMLFDGWEWLGDSDKLLSNAPHLEGDLSLLKALAAQNRLASDRAAWAKEVGKKRNTIKTQEVWFCFGGPVSKLHLQMASIIFNVPTDSLLVWRLENLDGKDLNAAALKKDSSESGFDRLLIGAHTVEESAWSAVQAVMNWRSQGIDDIGVIALDRKATRRMRAILERVGEPFSDASGWALDTTVAASAVFGLVDILSARANTQSLLEWIHSPFVFRGLAGRFGFTSQQQRHVDEILRAYGRVSHVSLHELCGEGLLPQGLGAQFSKISSAQTKALSDRIDQLMHALNVCGMDESLANDAAGQAVLSALTQIQAQAGTTSASLSTALWHALLSREMSEARFIESQPDACLRVCSIASLLWKMPKALLLLGADAQRLPARRAAHFFEPQRIAQMGLAVLPEQDELYFITQMHGLWNLPIPIVFVACSEKPDSQAEFANVIELFAMHPSQHVRRLEAAQYISQYPLQPFGHPSERVSASWGGALPDEISTTEAQRLIQCPYQFYLSRLIGLGAIESLEDDAKPSDVGTLIHAVLARAREGQCSHEQWVAWLTENINERLNQNMAGRPAQDVLNLKLAPAVATKLRADLMALVDPLADWLTQRGELDAKALATEETFYRELPSIGVKLKGRIDRFEDGPDGALLIDFKTTSGDELKKQIKYADAGLQLALYAWLLTPHKRVRDARYVSIRREAVIELGIASDKEVSLQSASEASAAQVQEKLNAMALGLPIEILGDTKDKSICERCSVRGVCRRDEWVVTDEHA